VHVASLSRGCSAETNASSCLAPQRRYGPPNGAIVCGRIVRVLRLAHCDIETLWNGCLPSPTAAYDSPVTEFGRPGDRRTVRSDHYSGSPVSADSAGALAAFSQAIAADILTSPELSDPGWDTYSLLAEVSDDFVAMTAYRYTESGPPVSTGLPEDDDKFWELRDATRGIDGQAWDVVLIKIHRDTASLIMNFVSGDAAEIWRIRPENMEHLAEAMRPRPEDFGGS
jgi:hypothetical protein